jgi:hypothetical protein
MKHKILGLQNLLKVANNENKLRSNDLRDDCNNLWNSNEELRNLTFDLRMKVEEV